MSSLGSRRDHLSARLGPLDRATLWLWRALNVVGWSALGWLIAVQLHWFLVQTRDFPQTAGFHRAGDFTVELGPGVTAGIIAWRLLVALIAGVVIGWIVARRVYARRPLVASLAALAYALFAMIALEHSRSANLDVIYHMPAEWLQPNSIARAALHDAAILAVVPIAWWRARVGDVRATTPTE